MLSDAVADSFAGLQIGCYRFTLHCRSELRLDPFVANELRGDFGNILRHRACLHPQACLHSSDRGAPCRDSERCLYGSLFSPRDAQGRAIVRPYIIEPAFPYRLLYAAGETCSVRLTLIGGALGHLPACVEVIAQLGKRGWGRDYREGYGRFEIEQMEAMEAGRSWQPLDFRDAAALRSAPWTTGAEIIQKANGLCNGSVQRLTLCWLSPLHLRDARPPRRPLREIEFHHVWDALQQRIEQLLLHHGGTIYRSEFKALKGKAKEVRKVEDALHWQARERRTSRQQTADMGGLLGYLAFEGELAPFLSILALGQWFHVGHGADLGNGRYRMVSD